jgi:ParB/RepB/Spo0J family partition protein
MIPIEMVKSDKKQPRQTFENIEELAETTKQNGIIQPLIVRKNGNDFIIVDGERRYRAAKIVGLKNIPCLVRPNSLNLNDILEMQLILNLHSDKVKPEEIAPKVIDLMKKNDWSTHVAATQLGCSERQIQDYKELVGIDKEEREAIDLFRKTDGEKGISSSNLVEIKRTIKSDRERKKILKKSKIKSVRRTEIRKMNKDSDNSNPEKEISVKWKEFTNLDGNKSYRIEKINDGSVIRLFNKTPPPKDKRDVVCPHFTELIWATGCPYDCAWCYLKGTFRYDDNGTKPKFKDREKIKKDVEDFIRPIYPQNTIPLNKLNREETYKEILNTGELADSLMGEGLKDPFSKFIIQIFEKQDRHKVLFLTKSDQVKNLLSIKPVPKQVVISFTLNAIPVAGKWERGAVSVKDRIEAATKVSKAGYETRIRIDPLVPIDDWKKHYLELIDAIFSNFIPERITLGSLRGLRSTLNNVKDDSWTIYLTEDSNWGKKVNFNQRFQMYKAVIEYLKEKYNFKKIALCKETLSMWDALKMDWKNPRCNCIW